MGIKRVTILGGILITTIFFLLFHVYDASEKEKSEQYVELLREAQASQSKKLK